MTLKEADITVEELMAVRDQTLVEAYETHDIGYDILVARLEAYGYHVVDHGDDARHVSGVYYGDGPDLAIHSLCDGYQTNDSGIGSTFIDCSTGQFVSVTEATERLCYIEIKTKTDPAWFGRCNRRHFEEYVNVANEVDEPVFIWFALVGEEEFVEREAFVRVEDTDQISGDVVDVSEKSLVFYEEDVESVNDDDLVIVDSSDIIDVESSDIIVDYVPDVHGNEVIELNEKEYRSWPYVQHVIS